MHVHSPSLAELLGDEAAFSEVELSALRAVIAGGDPSGLQTTNLHTGTSGTTPTLYPDRDAPKNDWAEGHAGSVARSEE
jgi:hypothetical protein